MNNNTGTSLKLKLEWFIKIALLIIVSIACVGASYWVIKSNPITKIQTMGFAEKAKSAFSIKIAEQESFVPRR